jgi:hypothetical protein
MQSETSGLRRQVGELRSALNILQHQNSGLYAEIETLKTFSKVQGKTMERQVANMTAMQVDVDKQSYTLRQNLCLERRHIEARLVKLEAARPVTVTAPQTTSGADFPYQDLITCILLMRACLVCAIT